MHSYLIFITPMRSKYSYYHSHYTDEKIDAQRFSKQPRIYHLEMAELRLESQVFLDFESILLTGQAVPVKYMGKH